MAYSEEVTYKGQNQSGTLNSTIRIEEGRGRLVVSEGSNTVITLSKQGLDFFNLAGLNDIRLGTMPDGQRYLLMMKDGYSIEDGFN